MSSFAMAQSALPEPWFFPKVGCTNAGPSSCLHSASGASRNYSFYEHLTELLPKLGIAVFGFLIDAATANPRGTFGLLISTT